jgi:GNAT superfamily N-acetyltransferase
MVDEKINEEKIPEKISPKDIRIERISQVHEHVINSFKSYEKELVDFLKEDALDNQEREVSTTHLWFLKGTNYLIGYVTLLSDSLNLNSPLKEEFRNKGINYKSLPALKIGRLCVDDRFLKKGVGRIMLQFVINIIREMNKFSGCRFITVDAKRNEDKSKDSIHFYKKMGFKVLREREKGTTPMYKDISRILKSLNEL